MPPAKKRKGGRGRPAAEPDTPADSGWALVAQQNWLRSSTKPTSTSIKVKSSVVKTELWEPLSKDGFPTHALLALDDLQLLSGYLWPGYNEDASDLHVLLMLLVTTAKKSEHLDPWTVFADRPADFASFFRRVLEMSLDTGVALALRTHILAFIMLAFHSLDCPIVRKECAPLVSIGTWHHIASDARRDALLDQTPHLRKAWRAAAKRFDAADDASKARLRFDRAWLHALVLTSLGVLYTDTGADADAVRYAERFVELLTDLQSQLPTRRYVNALLQDLHVLPALALAPLAAEPGNDLLRDMHAVLAHYTHFGVDDQTGAQLSEAEAYDRRCAKLANLQRTALEHFKDKLSVLALSNYGAISKRADLAALLAPLDDAEVVRLAELLHLRTAYPASCAVQIDRPLLVEALLATYESTPTFQDATRALRVLPTDTDLFAVGLQRADAYDGTRPLALPKLNLQYLSVGDFLWRSLVLYRCEAFYSIRQDIEAAVQQLQLQLRPGRETSFAGIARMAVPIGKPEILQVVPPRVGEDTPALVKASVTVDFRHVREHVRREWEALRPDDAVFLVAVRSDKDIRAVRTAEVMHAFDGPHAGPQRFTKTLTLKLDTAAFVADTAASPDDDDNGVYDTINVLVRRSGRENNFRPVLESIQSLVLSDVPLAPWLHEVFLGYGDPAAATYKHLPNRVKTIDFYDTFLDWHHLIESLPGKTVEPSDDASGSFGPPYVLGLAEKTAEKTVPAPTARPPSKKRRRDAEPVPVAEVETLKVSTYTPPNNGPYPEDARKTNTVRFTPAQTEAIIAGTQPGLTVVVGPPGTGKTDVATQIIRNLYHNFPAQRTLVIAHSNQALNQLFAKIAALDIDERHLLRLGRGDVDGDESDSKHGRVETVMAQRDRLLGEVTRLAASLGAPGAHGNSAETAGYFAAVYVEPRWRKFNEVAGRGDGGDTSELVSAFPFHAFFADAPQPLFPPDAGRDAVLDIANGCYRHIRRMFDALADAQPFEILRRERDKANYLLTREARIVAMTSTHAAMRRGEIARLGFRYDSVVVEEAAQITEIESFIPLAMQKSKDRLQRVVLCGDHLQNSPIVQGMAFRHYANLEQSLFARLVRLGVPTVRLDQQGRARPAIADLYRWRYPGLGDLPAVVPEDSDSEGDRFATANAGFRYEYQFVDVPDYHGRGESEPAPHFLQNLGEAEYAVAIFQYMRLLGYPAASITILATYAGQRALIREVLHARCDGATGVFFGRPRAVATVDQYQGEQNDYVILSLTRTARVGYLRDLRRLTVALSRARLGLYVLGRRSVFSGCAELRDAFQLLLQRPDRLALVTGEMWPSVRVLADEAKAGVVAGEVAMAGVEHLVQYVLEMTKTKLQQLAEAEAEASDAIVLADDDDIVALPGTEHDDDDDDNNLEEIDELDEEDEQTVA